MLASRLNRSLLFLLLITLEYKLLSALVFTLFCAVAPFDNRFKRSSECIPLSFDSGELISYSHVLVNLVGVFWVALDFDCSTTAEEVVFVEEDGCLKSSMLS